MQLQLNNKRGLWLACSLLLVLAGCQGSSDDSINNGKEAGDMNVEEVSVEAKPLGLVVEGGEFLRYGEAYRGIGVNYFNAFFRTLQDPSDTSYEAGFKELQAYGIPFIRFSFGFWPADWSIYMTDEGQYFALLDAFVASAEQHGIGLIPSFFFNAANSSDLVGEPFSAFSNENSKTAAFMKAFVEKIVTRYRDSDVVWGWELSNEVNLNASLPNASDHRPLLAPELGTPQARTEQDEITHAGMVEGFRIIASEVRKHDPHQRAIFTGNSFPRSSEWNQREALEWKADTQAQYEEILLFSNPDPVDTVTVHAYFGDEARFGQMMGRKELLSITLNAAKRAGKPLFVGEFGAGDELPADSAERKQKIREKYEAMLAAVDEAGVPLAAMWVYDFPNQPLLTVTGGNERAYQLELISELNKQYRAELAAARP